MTVITGTIADSGSVHDLLDLLRGRRIPLRSLAQVEPGLEEVFLTLIREPAND